MIATMQMPYPTQLADSKRARLRKKMIVFFVQLLLLLYLLILQPIRCCKKNGKKPGAMASKTNDNKIKKKRRSKEKGEKKGSKEKIKKQKEGKIAQKEEKPVVAEEPLKTDQTQEDDEEPKKEEEEKEPTLPPEQTQTNKETEASKKKPVQKFLIISMLGQKEELPEAGYAKDGEEVLAAFNKMQCEWDEKGGEASVAITNKTDTNLAMKIKSSDNNLFRVRPVYSNIEPGKSVDLGIYRSAGPIKNDRIVVVLTKNTKNDPAEKVFADKSIKTITTIIRQTGKEGKDEEKIYNKAGETPLEGMNKPSEKEQKKEEETANKKEEEPGAGGTQAVKPPEPKMLSAKMGPATVARLNVMQCEWDDKGGRKTITVSNTSNETLAMKIKCSDNNIFRIDPVFTNIEPGKSANVAIIRSAAPAKEDKVVVVLAKNILNVAPETVYKDKSIPTAMLTLPQKPIVAR